MSVINPFNLLPDENVICLLSFLDGESLICCSQIDKRFNRLAKDDHLWKILVPHANPLKVKSIRDIYFKSRNCELQLLKEIEKLAKTAEDGETYKIKIKVDSVRSIEIKFGVGSTILRKKYREINIRGSLPSVDLNRYGGWSQITLNEWLPGHGKIVTEAINSSVMEHKICKILTQRLEADNRLILYRNIATIAVPVIAIIAKYYI